MKFLIFSVIVISVIGTLSHFLYDISHHNKIVGLFAAVNESVWEHIKIALTPTLLWGLLDGYIYGTNANYFFAKFVSLFAIIILMPMLYYGIKALIKKDSLVIDIISFYVIITISQYLFYLLLRIDTVPYFVNYLSCAGVFLLFGGYMIHTLMPAKNFLFKDPISNKYGYKGHTEEFCAKHDKK